MSVCIGHRTDAAQEAARRAPERPPALYPRMPRHRCRKCWHQAVAERSLEETSALLSTIENDADGVPVLFRQCLMPGGRMPGFSVGPQFSSGIDGLVRVDLREADPRQLRKYMGETGAEALLAAHAVETARSA